MPDLRRLFHVGVPDDYRRIRDFRRAGHAYPEQYRAVSWLSDYDKNRSGTGVHLPRTGSMGLELRLIQPGKQTQNGFIESFNGGYRDECLNEHWFSDIVHAKKTINDWRQDYNECRPHSSLNYQTPAEFAADWRNGKYE